MKSVYTEILNNFNIGVNTKLQIKNDCNTYPMIYISFKVLIF